MLDWKAQPMQVWSRPKPAEGGCALTVLIAGTSVLVFFAEEHHVGEDLGVSDDIVYVAILVGLVSNLV